MIINATILHPNYFYFTINGSWASVNYLEIWNKGNIATTVNNNTVYKTIYDPAPYDYVEPKPAAFTGFTTTGYVATSTSQFNVNSYDNGWNFYCQPNFTGQTIYFPILGNRTTYSGYVNTTNAGCVYDWHVNSYYLTVGPTNSISYSFMLNMSTLPYINPQHELPKSYGALLRPVLE